MEQGSLLGLAVLNALFLLAGASLLWALRGWRLWSDFVRLAGLAYLLGVTAVTLLVSQLLILGASASAPLVLACCLGVAAAGLSAGVAVGRPRPAALLRGGTRPEPLLAVGVAFSALTVLLLQSFFLTARVQPLTAWDAWAFWTTKAKAIYFFGGLEREFFTALHAPTYPLVIPALEAMAFRFMGAADTIALHVQFWLLGIGFVLAVAGLLRPRVPLALLWPFLALLVLMPEFLRRAVQPTADWTLNYLFVLGALCIALWLGARRETWLLAASALMLAGALSTKRTGLLLAVALLAAAALVTWRERGHAWPRLAAVGAAAVATTLPWRLWVSRNVTAEADALAPASGIPVAWTIAALAVPGLLAGALWLDRGRLRPLLRRDALARLWERTGSALVVVACVLGGIALALWHVAAGDLAGDGIAGHWERRDRILPALGFVLRLLFRYESWLLAVPLGLAAAVVVLVLRRRDRVAGLYLATLTLGVSSFVWIQWAVPEMPLQDSGMTPIPRAVGALVLLSVVFAPLLLARLLGRDDGFAEAEEPAPARSAAA